MRSIHSLRRGSATTLTTTRPIAKSVSARSKSSSWWPSDQRDIRTHWHSGDKKLDGLPGDDLLVGPKPIHGLQDAFRLYLGDHPDELDEIRADHPSGPLATSYCTNSSGDNKYRYDAIWVSAHFAVESVEYVYDQAIDAGTDHALVQADLVLVP